MDEPFAAVDAPTERTIVNVLRELKSAGKTALVVHHDLRPDGLVWRAFIAPSDLEIPDFGDCCHGCRRLDVYLWRAFLRLEKTKKRSGRSA